MKRYLIIFLLFSSLLSLYWCNSESEEQDFVFNIPDNYTEVIETPDITVRWEKVDIQWDRLKVWDVLDTTKVSDFSWYRIIETVPSLDTPVCTMQTKQLESAAKMFPEITFLIISNDTPFALQRFCAANSINNLVVVSDARTREFWIENGLFLPKYGLLARSIFIVDENMKIVYVDYAEEVTNELDLWNALAFLKTLKK